jgi:hypothetical protein
MNKKGGGLAIAVLLVLTGALRWLSPGGSPGAQTPQETSKSDSGKHAKSESQHPHASLGPFADELGDTIEQFFGLGHEQFLAAQSQNPSPDQKADLHDLRWHWNVPTPDRPRVRFLIVLTPDPLHTQLNLFFDRGIETIQQAAQEQGYDFDRATMPWDAAEHPESTDFEKREQETAASAAREALPGLMIFRPQVETRQESERGPLFVFVIGETPTAGIHKDQFANALEIICEIQDCRRAPKDSTALTKSRNAPDPAPLLILGPSSSGSLYSLQRSLDLNRSLIGDQRIFVFSGTLRGTAQRCWFDRQTSQSNVRFVSFQEGEDRVIRKFLDFAKSRGYLPKDTAILSEDETSYGDVSANSVKLDPSCDLGYGPPDQLRLQFPRGISHFRSAYQKHVPTAAPSQDAERAVLPLDLQATGSEDDSVPSYAKTQFPLSQEAVMLGIVARLHRSHPKFIVLRASDPVDQLFLTRYLRQNYPQGRVVVTAPDLLYAREDDGLLHGVLGISAYSLVPEANAYLFHPLDPFANRPRSQRAFPGSSNQGLYNAMVSLLAIGENPSLGSALFDPSGRPDLTDLPHAPYSSYGGFRNWRADNSNSPNEPCEGCLAPGLWISILARDGYWMAATIPWDSTSSLHQINEPVDSTPRVHGPRTPKSWIFAYSFVLFLLFVHSYLVWTGSILSGSEIRARFGSIEDPAAPPDPAVAAAKNLWRNRRRRPDPGGDSRTKDSLRNRRRRVFLLTFGTASLAVIVLLLVGTRHAGVSRQGCGATILLLLLPLAFTYAVSWNLYKDRGELEIAAGLAAGITIFALSTFSPWLGPAYWLQSLTAYRSMHLASGVSPLLPFLLLIAAFYCMSWCELQALSVSDARRPRLPCRTDLPADYHRVSEEEVSELRDLATSLSIPRRVIFPILCCLTPVTLLTLDFPHPHPVQTIEGSLYDWLYFFFVLFWLILFLGCLSRLVCVWNECRRFLGGLDNLPLRDAFKRLQDFSWSLIWVPGGSALRDSFKNVSRELHSVQQLRKAIDDHQLEETYKISPDLTAKLSAQLKLIDTIQRTALVRYRIAAPGKSAGLAENQKHVPIVDRIRKWWKAETQTQNAPKKIARLMKSFGDLQEQLGKMAGLVMKGFLEPSSHERVSPVASWVPRDTVPKKTPAQLVAEEFVSLVYANFLTSVLLRIRTLVTEAIGIFLLLLFSISSYPFEPNPDMFTLAVLLIFVMGVVIAYVYSQMHRDPALSRLTSTAEGELGLEFWGQLLAAGAIPVLSLLALQFPSLSRVLINLLGPALQAIK